MHDSDYDLRREATVRRTKYKKGNKVKVWRTCAEFRKGMHGVVEQVELDKPGTHCSTGVLLTVRVVKTSVSVIADAYWWRKVS